MGGTGWNRSRGHPPKCSSTSDNPSVTAAPCQLPLHKGAFPCGGRGDRTGDADCRVASLLAMTVLNLCHSEEAQRADVGIRPFYDGRWFGPPRSSAPTEGLPKSQQRADIPKVWLPPTKFHAEIWGVGQVVGPYGKPKPAGAQRSARARVGEGWAGIGARTIPKRGPPPRPPRQRLAKRKARKEQLVKFDFCPMTSEFSTAHNARRFQQSSARAPVGTAITEQDRLAPHPAARQGAPRP